MNKKHLSYIMMLKRLKKKMIHNFKIKRFEK